MVILKGLKPRLLKALLAMWRVSAFEWNDHSLVEHFNDVRGSFRQPHIEVHHIPIVRSHHGERAFVMMTS
jgi:hypothetical protein